MMEEKIKCKCHMIFVVIWLQKSHPVSEPKLRAREERSFSHLFLLLRRFDSRVRSVAI
jgi:hypothetical protein